MVEISIVIGKITFVIIGFLGAIFLFAGKECNSNKYGFMGIFFLFLAVFTFLLFKIPGSIPLKETTLAGTFFTKENHLIYKKESDQTKKVFSQTRSGWYYEGTIFGAIYEFRYYSDEKTEAIVFETADTFYYENDGKYVAISKNIKIIQEREYPDSWWTSKKPQGTLQQLYFKEKEIFLKETVFGGPEI